MDLEESVNHSMVLDIIDWYKKAIIQTRERDVRIEQACDAHSGELFHAKYKIYNNDLDLRQSNPVMRTFAVPHEAWVDQRHCGTVLVILI